MLWKPLDNRLPSCYTGENSHSQGHCGSSKVIHWKVSGLVTGHFSPFFSFSQFQGFPTSIIFVVAANTYAIT